jgi:hypothetical protein
MSDKLNELLNELDVEATHPGHHPLVENFDDDADDASLDD